MPRQIRKQVHELTEPDLEAFPGWAYASDEEGSTGQDECTVRPLTLEEVRTATGQVFVRALFVFPNGCSKAGIVTLNAGEDPSGHQPVLFEPGDGIAFYVGAREPKLIEVRRFNSRLRSVSSPHLPIQYASVLESPSGKALASGVLEGLYWLSNVSTGELRAVA